MTEKITTEKKSEFTSKKETGPVIETGDQLTDLVQSDGQKVQDSANNLVTTLNLGENPVAISALTELHSNVENLTVETRKRIDIATAIRAIELIESNGKTSLTSSKLGDIEIAKRSLSNLLDSGRVTLEEIYSDPTMKNDSVEKPKVKQVEWNGDLDPQRKERFKNVKNIKELLDEIILDDNKGGMYLDPNTGMVTTFDPLYLKNKIGEYLRNESSSEQIPITDGLRDVVERLKKEIDIKKAQATDKRLDTKPSESAVKYQKPAKIVDIGTGKELSPDQINTRLIASADSFDDLTALIKNKNISTQGSNQLYTPDVLIDIVSKVRTRELDINDITRNLGLRDKLIDLLDKDNDVDTLKRTLDEVWKKLNTESFYSGASSDSHLNRRRDQRLKWQERIKAAIRKIDENKNR